MSCRRAYIPIRMLVFRKTKWSPEKRKVFESYPSLFAGAITKEKPNELKKTLVSFTEMLKELYESRGHDAQLPDISSLLVIDRDPNFLKDVSEFNVSTMHICKYSKYPQLIGDRMFKARSLAYIPHAIDHMN